MYLFGRYFVFSNLFLAINSKLRLFNVFCVLEYFSEVGKYVSM